MDFIVSRPSIKRLPAHMVERDGRYSSRLIVPAELRPFLGKSALWKALGGDLTLAKRRHKIELGILQQQIGQAERQRAAATASPIRGGRYPLTPSQMAGKAYQEMLEFDRMARATTPLYAQIEIDWEEARRYRDGYAGRLDNDELEYLVGEKLAEFALAGNHSAKKGSVEWRQLAQALCYVRMEIYKRQGERDDGDFTGRPVHPELIEEPSSELAPVSLLSLFNRYARQGEPDGKPSSLRKRWTPVFRSLCDYIGHDDANRFTSSEIQRWLDKSAETLSPKTINAVYFASVRAVLRWAYRNKEIQYNPCVDIFRRKVRTSRSRNPGFSEQEALTVLKAALNYKPSQDDHGRSREYKQTVAAKRWAPWLAAHTGARIAEITQLRKADVQIIDGVPTLVISPDAGATKSGRYRVVPLHRQLVELGFLEFVNQSPSGPLFFQPGDRTAKSGANQVAKNLSVWIQRSGLVPEGLAPNHAWRHRFKSVGEEIGISSRILDALQDHAPRSSGENYGVVTFKAKVDAIERFPEFLLV